jgi:hypothetical protein
VYCRLVDTEELRGWWTKDWVFETTYQPQDGVGTVALECGERRGDSNMPEAGSDQCEIIERIIVICRYL